MNDLIFSPDAWKEYKAFESEDRKALKRINSLIDSIQREGLLGGIGKPERLKNGFGYSRRIDEKNRLVYEDWNGVLRILSCKGHYQDA
jgi:toxin YoeB